MMEEVINLLYTPIDGIMRALSTDELIERETKKLTQEIEREKRIRKRMQWKGRSYGQN